VKGPSTRTGLAHTTYAMNTYPGICRDVGLDCQTCIEGTSRNLAKICKGVRGTAIGQLFVQIHSDPACAAMYSQFVKAYLAASIERIPVISERHRPQQQQTKTVSDFFSDPSMKIPAFSRQNISEQMEFPLSLKSGASMAFTA
jgi:hypothetical protein